jgi:hypothetical protein
MDKPIRRLSGRLDAPRRFVRLGRIARRARCYRELNVDVFASCCLRYVCLSGQIPPLLFTPKRLATISIKSRAPDATSSLLRHDRLFKSGLGTKTGSYRTLRDRLLTTSEIVQPDSKSNKHHGSPSTLAPIASASDLRLRQPIRLHDPKGRYHRRSSLEHLRDGGAHTLSKNAMKGSGVALNVPKMSNRPDRHAKGPLTCVSGGALCLDRDHRARISRETAESSFYSPSALDQRPVHRKVLVAGKLQLARAPLPPRSGKTRPPRRAPTGATDYG